MFVWSLDLQLSVNIISHDELFLLALEMSQFICKCLFFSSTKRSCAAQSFPLTNHKAQACPICWCWIVSHGHEGTTEFTAIWKLADTSPTC
jgi:hypothetical protein